MKFTLAWLKEHLETRAASVAEIDRHLARIGLEVEEVFDPATRACAVRGQKIIKCAKHANADKLSFYLVDTGGGRFAGRLQHAERALKA